jgi:hypothetical protein
MRFHHDEIRMDITNLLSRFVHTDIIDSGSPVLARGSNGDLEDSLTDIQAYEHFGTHTQLSLAKVKMIAILLPSWIIEPSAMNIGVSKRRMRKAAVSVPLNSWKFSLIGERMRGSIAYAGACLGTRPRDLQRRDATVRERAAGWSRRAYW